MQIATAGVTATVLLIVPLLFTGCPAPAGSNAGGIGGSGIHGELNAGTTINPNDPTNINVGVGGKIYFAKRPLTPAEKREIHDAAFNLATTCIRNPATCNETSEKRKLTDRTRYRYRVTWAVVRPQVDKAWQEAKEVAR